MCINTEGDMLGYKPRANAESGSADTFTIDCRVRSIHRVRVWVRVLNQHAPAREAKGWTTSEVPMTSSRSAAGRSTSAASQKRSGSASPKNTMSGFTRPPHAVHLRTNEGSFSWSI